MHKSGWLKDNNRIENNKSDAKERLRAPRPSESLMVNFMSGVPEPQDVAAEINPRDCGLPTYVSQLHKFSSAAFC